MMRLDHFTPRTTVASASPRRARGAAHRPAREARIRRSFDGLVASYIRELAVTGDDTPRRGHFGDGLGSPKQGSKTDGRRPTAPKAEAAEPATALP
jgi:hypothetical protein